MKKTILFLHYYTEKVVNKSAGIGHTNLCPTCLFSSYCMGIKDFVLAFAYCGATPAKHAKILPLTADKRGMVMMLNRAVKMLEYSPDYTASGLSHLLFGHSMNMAPGL